MTLREARVAFTKNIPLLIIKAISLGYDPAIDDAKARDGHTEGSLHYIGLAIDLLLYDMNGKYLTENWHYRELATYWKTLHEFNYAGYDFGDGNHFSFSDWSIPGCVTADGRLRK